MTLPKLTKTSDGTLINTDSSEYKRYKAQRDSFVKITDLEKRVDEISKEITSLSTNMVIINSVHDKVEQIVHTLNEIRGTLLKR